MDQSSSQDVPPEGTSVDPDSADESSPNPVNTGGSSDNTSMQPGNADNAGSSQTIKVDHDDSGTENIDMADSDTKIDDASQESYSEDFESSENKTGDDVIDTQEVDTEEEPSSIKEEIIDEEGDVMKDVVKQAGDTSKTNEDDDGVRDTLSPQMIMSGKGDTSLNLSDIEKDARSSQAAESVEENITEIEENTDEEEDETQKVELKDDDTDKDDNDELLMSDEEKELEKVIKDVSDSIDVHSPLEFDRSHSYDDMLSDLTDEYMNLPSANTDQTTKTDEQISDVVTPRTDSASPLKQHPITSTDDDLTRDELISPPMLKNISVIEDEISDVLTPRQTLNTNERRSTFDDKSESLSKHTDVIDDVLAEEDSPSSQNTSGLLDEKTLNEVLYEQNTLRLRDGKSEALYGQHTSKCDETIHEAIYEQTPAKKTVTFSKPAVKYEAKYYTSRHTKYINYNSESSSFTIGEGDAGEDVTDEKEMLKRTYQELTQNKETYQETTRQGESQKSIYPDQHSIYYPPEVDISDSDDDLFGSYDVTEPSISENINPKQTVIPEYSDPKNVMANFPKYTHFSPVDISRKDFMNPREHKNVVIVYPISNGSSKNRDDEDLEYLVNMTDKADAKKKKVPTATLR